MIDHSRHLIDGEWRTSFGTEELRQRDTGYGLAAAVWSGSREASLRVARRLRAGQVDVNGAAFNPLAPFGGFGLSCIGREGGRFGIQELLEPRAIQIPG